MEVVGANHMEVESVINDPFQWLEGWLSDQKIGSLLGILATVGIDGKPYTRTISIREVNEKGVLFFTQSKSKKTQHIQNKPATSLTIYLPKSKRQITLHGLAKALSTEETISYWNRYPKESQLRFLVYGPRSGEKISSNAPLDEALEKLKDTYRDTRPDRPESYVGYRICPGAFEFYQLNMDRMSDAFIVDRINGKWKCTRVVP